MNSGVIMDKVVISIETNAGKATSGIDSLSNSLDKLKESIAGGFNNLNTLATALEKLTSIDLSGVSDNIEKPIEDIAKALQPLSEVQGSGFAGAVRGLNQLKTAVVGLESMPSSLGPVKEIASAFEPLSNIKSGGFNNLLKSLDRLKNSLSDLTEIGNSVGSIREIGNAFKELSNLKAGGFSKTVDTLSRLKTEAKGLFGTMIKLQSVKGIEIALRPLSSIKTTGLNKFVNQLQKLPSVMASITPQALENVGRVSTELANKLTPLADKLDQIGNGYKAISALADKYGVSVTKIRTNTSKTNSVLNKMKAILNKLISPFKKLKNEGNSFSNNLTKGISKLNSKLKQMGLALLGTRTIFTAVRKAISEYMNMDEELSSQLTNIWRAFGAQLAPAVEYVVYLFKQAVRVIYSFVYAITGVDLIARANAKAMSSWGKSAQDTLGTLQKFDDLNVVDFGKSTGSDNQLIQLDKIDLKPIQWLIDLIRELKRAIQEAFDVGKWTGVGKTVAKIFNQAFARINVTSFQNKLFKVVDKVNDYIKGFLNTFELGPIMEKIGKMLSTLFKGFTRFTKQIPWSKIGVQISDGLLGLGLPEIISNAMNFAGVLLKGFSDAILAMPFDKLAADLSNSILSALRGLDNIVNMIPWNKLGLKVREFLLNIEWKEIFTTILNLLWDVFKSSWSFILGLFGIDITPEDKEDSTGESSTGSAGKWYDFETFHGNVEYIFDDLSDNVVPESLNKIKSIWNEMCKDLNDTWEENGPVIEENVNKSLDNIGKGFKKLYDNDFKPSVDGIMEDLEKLYDEHIKPFINKLGFDGKQWSWIWEKMTHSTDYEGGLIGKLVTKISDIVTGKLGAVFDVLGWIFDVITDIVALVTSRIDGDLKGELMAAYNLAVDILNPCIDIINLIIAGINKILSYASKIGIKSKLPVIPSIEKLQKYDYSEGELTGYATGGYPERGQYFYARENGVPELVGSIGSQTAVANNTQIIQGIKQGVKEAIQESDINFTNVVNVGNKTLYKEQQSYNKMQNNKYGTITI